MSSKVGNAVVRNRIKRWVREWVRRHKSALPPGEGVVVAKASAASVAHPTCDGDLARLFGKARS